MKNTYRSWFQMAAAVAGCLLIAWEAVAVTARFDHFSTGFPLTSEHSAVDCATCHVGGIFKGTPTRCAACHGPGGVASDSAKPARHIPSDDNCGNCHAGRRWSTNVRVDHNTIPGTCFTCHNGIRTKGKHPNHVQSDNDCAGCHNTLSWSSADYDHIGIVTGCVTCHNGSTATGKHAKHVASGNNCEQCHSTRGWLPAGYDHVGVVPGSCNNCHNGVTARGKQPGHFGTTRSCDDCHTTTSFKPSTFTHTSPNYPTNHSIVCSKCHKTRTEAVTWAYPAYAPSCAGCHTDKFNSAGHHRGDPIANYVDCARSRCHSTSRW